jgi:hypothetical protein
MNNKACSLFEEWRLLGCYAVWLWKEPTFWRNLAPLTSNRRTLRRLLVRASIVPSSPILVTLMKEALRSSETSVFTRATWRNIPEDAILHSHRRENLRSYMFTLYLRITKFLQNLYERCSISRMCLHFLNKNSYGKSHVKLL